MQVADSLLALVDQAPPSDLSAPEEGNEAAAAPSALLALLRACRTTGQWQLARLVLEMAPGHGFPPSVATLNEAIAACAAQGAATEAQEIFDSLAAAGLEPDAGSYGNLLEAYHAAGQWVEVSAAQ